MPSRYDAGQLICELPGNEYNQFLEDLADRLRGALRLPKPQYQGQGTLSQLQHAVINTAAAGNFTIIPGVAGQIIKVYSVFMWNVAAQNLEFLDGINTLTGPLTAFGGGAGLLFPLTEDPYFELSNGGSFIISLSAATQVSGFTRYRTFTP